MLSRRIKDITKQKFNSLFVDSFAYTKKAAYWNCICDCGNKIVVRGDSLKNNHTKSCGCFYKERSEKTRRKISENRKGKGTGKRPKEVGQKISKARKGMVFTKEHKENLSKSHIGNAPWNKGKTNVYSIEHLRKMSERQKGVSPSLETRKKIGDGQRGEKHWNWNSNITDEERVLRERDYPEYREWRTQVFKRDKYICQKCHMPHGKHLRAHHINSYNDHKEIRTRLSNGITLCEWCHKDFHHCYGYGNNTEEQMNDFLNIEKELRLCL